MSKLEEATFGAGCFWGVEELYRTTPGVKETEVGYMGGNVENPSYDEVATRTTGHAEVVHLKFDSSKVAYKELLDIFWNNHNPTTLNRQGLDIGTEYRSVIFFHSTEQEKIAQKSKEEMNNSDKFSNPIVTQIEPASAFYKAEDYHQKYLMKRGRKVC